MEKPQTIEDIMEKLERFPHTESLNLSSRSLHEVPKSLTKFQRLKHLYLNNNCLIFVPELGQLQDLEELTLEDNRITLIPETFFNLKNLTCLNLNRNPLSHLNEKMFVSLKNLSILWLNECQIMHLPKEIAELKFLERLGLRSNLLENLPDELGQLSNLKWLCLEKNELRELPSSFKNLTRLGYLNLNRNVFEKVPEVLYGLKDSLSNLSLAHNKIASLTDNDILELGCIQRVDFSNNPFLLDQNTQQKELYQKLFSFSNFILK